MPILAITSLQCLFISITICCMFIYLIIYTKIEVLQFPEENFTSYQDENQSKRFLVDTPGCKIPLIDPLHAALFPYIEYPIPLFTCNSSLQLMVMEKGYLKFNPEVKDKVEWSVLSCGYLPIFRKFDHSFEFEFPFQPIKDEPVEIFDEFIMVECNFTGQLIYQDFFASILYKRKVERRCKEILRYRRYMKSYSILLLHLDSVSRTQFHRLMFKTEHFIKNEMDYFEFKGFNTIGRNPVSNLIPLTTGRPGMSLRNEHDRQKMRLIWRQFSSRGYRTLFAEDEPKNSVFYKYYAPEFRYQRPDYDFRPLSVAVQNSKMRSKIIPQIGCFPDRPESSMILKWTQDLFDEFNGNPVFAYISLSHLTRYDYNGASYLDDPIQKFLQELYFADHLENSLVFLFSDHGFHHGEVSLTYQGQEDEKLPFFFLLVPSGFEERYPEFYKNLKLNEKRLVTTFDIHATMMDASNYLLLVRENSVYSQSVSLFSPISDKRNCKYAGVDVPFCSCHGDQSVSKRSQNSLKAGRVIVNEINLMTSDYRNLCSELKLVRVLEVFVETIILREDDENIYGNYVNLTVRVNPSNAVFKSVVLYNRFTDTWDLVDDIYRVDEYRNQSMCVKSEDLKPFCYCYYSNMFN